MTKVSREKIALVVFGALVVASVAVFSWYIGVGHSWNFAASAIDDAVGDMDGYTVIVYAGTTEPAIYASRSSEDTLLDESLDVDESQEGTDVPSSESAELGEEGDSNDDDSATDSAVGADAEDGTEDGTLNDAASETEDTLSSAVDFDELTTIEQEYVDKGATVLALHTTDLSRYEEGLILKRGSMRFGVLSIQEDSSFLEVRKIVSWLSGHEVDLIIAVVDSLDSVGNITGIDVVIATDDEESSSGVTDDGSFCLVAPERGSVGVIMISPSNVVSSKVISDW